MKINLEKERLKLLSSPNVKTYLELLAKSTLPRGYKGSVTKEWLQKHGMSIHELNFHKRQHPYWKRQRTQSSLVRQLERQKQYNFKKEESARMVWNPKKLEKFIELNSKLVDWQLAKKFKTSLPAINHIRRKIKYAHAILEKTKKEIRPKDLIFYIVRSERVLKKELLEANSQLTNISLNGSKRKN
jgi:hypothetical protein